MELDLGCGNGSSNTAQYAIGRNISGGSMKGNIYGMTVTGSHKPHDGNTGALI